MGIWSGVITRNMSGTIEVEVIAESKGEAEEKIKENLRMGKYDQRLLDQVSFNAECEEDSVYDVREDYVHED